ncbi:MAG: sulfotransferase [Xanthomonadales bacterium]|nr:sulfotransferase [Xanthomonadales bacterium]
MPPSHHNLGYALQEQDRMEEAVASYQRAISIKPGLAEAHTNIGLLYEKMNDLPTAEKYIAKALGISPGAANIKYAQSVILRRRGKIDEAIQLLESLDIKSVRDPNTAKNIHFELGRLYDRKKNSAKAFHNISCGNRLHARSYQSTLARKDEFLAGIDALKRTLSRDWVRSWSAIPQVQAATNAFIVGFPRSGTTLLDQILDSHPGIQVMEEKDAIEHVVRSIAGDYPQSLASLTESDVRKSREIYFKAVDGYITRDTNTILVDKFPLNIQHVPLLVRLFPDARIILAMRHPCDVVLSNFMQNYRINNAMANFFTIEDSALAYTQVMGLWQKSIGVMPVDFHTVKYESLVADFNNEVGQLLKFLGVDWDDAVLAYDSHAKKRGTIRTPSYQSVTEPIYQRAKYRWKRYEEQLKPVMDDLRPFIEAFGY